MNRLPAVLACVGSLLSLLAFGCSTPDKSAADKLARSASGLNSGKSATASKPPPAEREFRAAWVATVGNIDWPSKKGLSADDQKAEAIAILDKSVDLKLNAIVLQVRTSADALYKSDIEPWSEFLTGEQGKDPGYDPLEFWVAEAHKRGLELHAWFNPFRAMYGGGDKDKRSKNHIWNTNRKIVKEYGNMLWMDPGEDEAEQITVKVFLDVVKRYDVDGVHIDDYFYPYPVTGKDKKEVPFPDDPSWQRYQSSGGKLNREDWRRENINRMIRDIYEGIHREKSWVKFGISPFGIWKPGYPQSIAGFNQYEKLYADAKLWLNKGWCDYWTPQLYWKLTAPAQAYEDLLNWWIDENLQHRHIWPGIFTTRIDSTAKSWDPVDIVNQVWVTKDTPGASGNVHFSMVGLVENRRGISDALLEGPYRHDALVPASPWLDAKAPAPPAEVQSAAVDQTGSPTTRPVVSSGRYPAGDRPATYPTAPTSQPTRMKLWTGRRVTWKPAGKENAWLWTVYARHGKDNWRMHVVPGDQTETIVFDDAGLGPVNDVVVAAVDRCGNESRRVTARTSK